MQMPMALSEHCSVLSWCSSPWYKLQLECTVETYRNL